MFIFENSQSTTATLEGKQGEGSKQLGSIRVWEKAIL